MSNIFGPSWFQDLTFLKYHVEPPVEISVLWCEISVKNVDMKYIKVKWIGFFREGAFAQVHIEQEN